MPAEQAQARARNSVANRQQNRAARAPKSVELPFFLRKSLIPMNYLRQKSK
jgi:hypothetical protein